MVETMVQVLPTLEVLVVLLGHMLAVKTYMILVTLLVPKDQAQNPVLIMDHHPKTIHCTMEMVMDWTLDIS
jgi:hypothetical protein